MPMTDWVTTVIHWFENLGDQIQDFVQEVAKPTDDFVGFPTFERSIQLDSYSCVANSVFAILRHYGRGVPYRHVFTNLRTDENGTTATNMVRYLVKHGFAVTPRDPMTMAQMRKALADGGVVLVDLEDDHVGVVYGMTDHMVLLADSSIRRQMFHIPMLRSSFMERWENKSGVIIKPRR